MAFLTSMLKTLKIWVFFRKKNNIEGDKRGDNNSNVTIKKNSNARFFTLKNKIIFIYLRKVFTEAPILYHYKPDWYIQIEINSFGYAIGALLS